MRPTTAKWWHGWVLVLLLAICSSTTAQLSMELRQQLIASGPDLAETVMEKYVKQAKAATTCHLILEGGSNTTELEMYGTSIARAELTCTGQMLQIAVHPVLAPFVRFFKGVNVTRIPDMQDLERAAAEATANEEACFSNTDYIISLCNSESVELLRPRFVNLRSHFWEQITSSAIQDGTAEISFSPGSLKAATVVGVQGVVSFIEPLMSDVRFMPFQATSMWYMKGGLVNGTSGVLSAGLALLDGTQFTHNVGTLYGAIAIMAGHAIFRDCVFLANKAPTFAETTRGVIALQTQRSGLGGAVVGLVTTQGVLSTPVQTSATFGNCSFIDNRAYEGGAIAMLGANLSITNCTFTGNSAMKNGFDVYTTQDGTVNITASNITASSPTVVWERVEPSKCWRGEFFGKLEGTCRRCPGSTYSLVTPVPASCNACPANAKCPGGDAIMATDGSFRVSNTSDKVVSCPRAGACLEGECTRGHEGVVCGSCSEGYAPAMPFKCVECASKRGAIAVFAASTLILIVFAGIGVQLTLTANREGAVDSTAVDATNPTAGDVVKLLALFLQYTSIIGSLPVPWPAPSLALITVSDWLFAGSVGQAIAWVKSPFECALKGLRVPSAMLKQLIYLLMPAFVALVLLLFFVSIYSCCWRSKKHTLRVTVVLMVSAFFTFPLVLRAAFSFFGCFRVEDPTLPHSLWWVQAMSQPCYQGAHRVWSLAVGLPFLVICCSAPLALGFWLWRNSARMGEPEFRERYGHLYRLYHARAYWYEPVILIQTITLVALPVFASQIGNYAAVVLTGLHIAMALQLLQLVRPYAAPVMHRLHVASLCCLLLDVFVALLMFDQSRPAGGAFAVAQKAASVFSLILSACFIIASCVCTCIFFMRGPGGLGLSKLFARWCGGSPKHTHGRRVTA